MKNKSNKNKSETKSKNKIFLILIIVSIVVVSIFGVIAFTPLEGEEEDYLITWDWLVPSVKENPNDDLRHSIGGEDLKEFESLGIFSTDETGIIFKARATFGFELNSYLGLTLEDCYPNININDEKNFCYLGVAYKWGIIPIGSERYYVTGRTVDLGDTFNNQFYRDPLELSVDIVPAFKDFGGQELNGVLINSIDHLYEIKTVKMDVVEHGLVGEYNDLYTDQDTQSGHVNVISLEKDDPGNAAARQGINDLTLGWHTDDLVDVEYNLTIQNVVYDSDPVGTTYHNSGTGAFNYDVTFQLRPEITYSEQTIHLRGAVLIVDTLLNTYEVYGAVTNFDDTRMRSIYVTAPFIHQEYEVNVYFLATVKLDADLYESALDDPYFVRGEWLWNEQLGGTTDVTIVESDPYKLIIDQILAWLTPIIIVAIIAVATYVIIQAGSPAIMYWLGRKSKS